MKATAVPQFEISQGASPIYPHNQSHQSIPGFPEAVSFESWNHIEGIDDRIVIGFGFGGQDLTNARRATTSKLDMRARISILACLLGVLLMFALPMTAQAQPQTGTPPPWNRAAAGQLLHYGQTISSQGLDPRDYALTALKQAMAGADQVALDQAATRSFALIARDLAEGHVRPESQNLVHLPAPTLTAAQALKLIDEALTSQDVAGTLNRLAPDNADYRALKAALAALPPGDSIHRAILRANMERWRWLPRDLGTRYLIDNIPEYLARLVDHGMVISTHKIIVGKPSTPTPQLSAMVNGIVFNPPWRVPRSIIAESVGRLVRNHPTLARKRGYVWSHDAQGTLRVTQLPGPNNALGQMRLDMPNPYAIYMHDTPSKALFDRKERAFSHGCLRTESPFTLAAQLLRGTSWDTAAIDNVISVRKTTRVALPKQIPIYVVYFTARPDPHGQITYPADLYHLDPALEQALGIAQPQPNDQAAAPKAAPPGDNPDD